MQSPLSFPTMNITMPFVAHGGATPLLSLALQDYTSIMVLIGLIAFLKTYTWHFQSMFKQYYTSTVYVKRSDEAYHMLLSWINSNGHESAARSSIAHVRTTNEDDNCHDTETKKPLNFSPWDGSFVFRFHNSLLSYRSELRDDGFRKEEVLSITCIGRSSNVLKDLLMECREDYLAKIKNRTTIFENHGDSWRKAQTRSIRPLSSVMVGRQQRKVVEDMREFLDPGTYKWFSERKIPYRRGYLFYGPPGTGKSSFSLSVAGEFDLDIYIASLADIEDQTLRCLFNELPRKCIVLLEDIDATSTSRSTDLETPNANNAKPKAGISLSGLLNTIDGVASQEGRILIMTTNHFEKLDEALIRPGRVDLKSEFQLADFDTAAKLFSYVFSSNTHGKENHGIWGLASDFASRLPQNEFSSAEILSYLVPRRQSSISALQGVDDWVSSARAQKRGARSISYGAQGSQVDQKGCSIDWPSTSPDGAARNDREDLMVFGDERVEDSLSAGCILPSLSPTGISGRPNTPLSLNLLQESPNVLDDDVLWMKTVRYHDLELLTTTQPRQETITPPLLCPDANGDNRQGSATRIRSHSCGRLAPLGDFEVAINSNTILQPSNKQRSQRSSLHSTSTIVSTLDNGTTDEGSRMRRVKRCTNLREASCIYSDIAPPEREETRGGGVTVTSCNPVTSGADSTPCLIRADSNATQNASDVFTDWSFLSCDGSISSASVCTSDTTVDTEDTNFDMDFAEFMTAEAVVVAGELNASTAPNNNAYELEIISLGDFPFTDTWYLSTSSLDDAGEPYVIEEPNEFRDVEDAMTPHE